ncbi:hypothetical protein BDZ89DRAFT_1161257 [Hymenopellis radicata]|nr:hypothetical protein BDZ89DRAFT_1161257 [Hymenopellis radicata]
MPADNLPNVRETVAEVLSEVLEALKTAYFSETADDNDIIPVYLRSPTKIHESFTPELSFPVIFSISQEAVTGERPSNARSYKALRHFTDPSDKQELLGQYVDFELPARSSNIILPHWHILQGIIASLKTPGPDIQVQNLKVKRKNVTNGGHDKEGGIAVIVVNENDLSQKLDTIAWVPPEGKLACPACPRIASVPMWGKQVRGVCRKCRHKGIKPPTMERTMEIYRQYFEDEEVQ